LIKQKKNKKKKCERGSDCRIRSTPQKKKSLLFDMSRKEKPPHQQILNIKADTASLPIRAQTIDGESSTIVITIPSSPIVSLCEEKKS
jgi:hypothetical protein